MNKNVKMFFIKLSNYYKEFPKLAQYDASKLPEPFTPFNASKFMADLVNNDVSIYRMYQENLTFFDRINLVWTLRKFNRTSFAHIFNGDVTESNI